ncbi:MAG: dockerin type I domain-containing protein [Porcipelethomonas sp.]
MKGKKILLSLLSVVMTLSVAFSSMTAAAVTPETSSVLYSSEENNADNSLSCYMGRYGTSLTSYLQKNTDGTISKVTADGSDYVSVDNYSADFKYQDSVLVDMELPVWGGYYCGREYNFFLFGQNNPDESDDTEVFRVVKYTKDWERVGIKSFFGCNTYIPFDAGTPRMYEEGGTLFIHTSHEMYLSDDGYHHQANVQLYIDIESMECTYSFYGVMNVGYCGYVSHSFDQYIKSDGSYVYTADHGDAYPRSVVICKKSAKGEMYGYTDAVPIYGSVGNNTTGLSLGGFELSDNNCIVAGNSIVQDGSVTDSRLRNVFVSVTDKSLSNTEMIWLTDFSESYKVSVPKLVKLSSDTFVVMWNEYENNEFISMHAVKIDGDGNILAESETSEAELSSCDPVVINGEITWVHSDGTSSDFYAVNSNLELAYPVAEEPTTEDVTSAKVTTAQTTTAPNFVSVIEESRTAIVTQTVRLTEIVTVTVHATVPAQTTTVTKNETAVTSLQVVTVTSIVEVTIPATIPIFVTVTSIVPVTTVLTFTIPVTVTVTVPVTVPVTVLVTITQVVTVTSVVPGTIVTTSTVSITYYPEIYFDMDNEEYQWYHSDNTVFFKDGIRVIVDDYDVTYDAVVKFSDTPADIYDGYNEDYLVDFVVEYNGMTVVSDMPVKIGVRGDVYGNGTTDIFDAAYIAKYMVGKKNMSSFQIYKADVNEDGEVDVFDAIAIAKYTVSRDENPWINIFGSNYNNMIFD